MNEHKKHLDIKYLEIINEVIDLCIDNELYNHFDEIIILEKQVETKIAALLKNNQDAEWRTLVKMGFEEFPIKKINLPSILAPFFPDQPQTLILDQYTDQTSLLMKWSTIYWVKRLRAIISEKNNKGIWLERYEDILLVLERRSYDKEEFKSKKHDGDYLRTEFNYLMELSAIAQGEASFGYAERARDVLNKLYKDPNDLERGPYDRWITWNKGTAYQHSGRNQKAVLEFNWVIKEFWYQNSAKKEKLRSEKNKNKNILLCRCQKGEGPLYFSTVLEFLTNVVPAYLQRAAINLKLQLGYHAIQTLNSVDNNQDNLLKKIKENNPGHIFFDAASHLQQRIELLRIEALLQLERLDTVRCKLEENYRVIFSHNWIPEISCLLKYETRSNLKFTEIQLIEQTVSWLLARERMELCQDNCETIIADLNKKLKRDIPEYEIDDRLIALIETAKGFHAISKAFKNTYWTWVKENQFDEQIYFSKWAQLLKHGSKLHKKLRDFSEPGRKSLFGEYNKSINQARNFILKAIINLYCARRQKLPNPQNKGKAHTVQNGIEARLKIERFRSDDLPDFISGLSAFYKEMSTIYCSNNGNFKKIARKILIQEGISRSFEELQDDHFNILSALDEFEIEFGENQKISFLKRCNERLIWRGRDVTNDCDEHCISQNESFREGYFHNLLTCPNAMASSSEEKIQDDDLLSGNNYEKIMRDAEEHFRMHLKSSSYQFPPKQALHFLGLQRWNSLTPAQGRSVGGGYFIYRTDKNGVVDLGIAIDPGFDFVRNFFRMGFSLRDIDIVLISHAHPDHLWDFESMVQLLHELKDKERITKRLNVILTLGSYRRLEHIINNSVLRNFINPLVIDIRKEIDPHFFDNLGTGPNPHGVEDFHYCFNFCFSQNNRNVKAMRWEPILPLDNSRNKEVISIWPTRAYHDDYSNRSDSFGFRIQFTGAFSNNSDKPLFSFGYTGDSKWVGDDLYNQKCPIHSTCQEKYENIHTKWKNVAIQYKDCDVLLLHLGSLINHKINDSFANYKVPNKNCKDLIREKNHPYLIGMIRFLRSLSNECRNDTKNKLLLISEFGEELRGGIRIDLIKRFQVGIKNGWQILPVDVGFDVLLQEQASSKKQGKGQHNSPLKFKCALCDKFCSIDEVEYTRFGQDEAIFYICKTCDKAEPFDVRHTKLRQLYEIGRELRAMPESE